MSHVQKRVPGRAPLLSRKDLTRNSKGALPVEADGLCPRNDVRLHCPLEIGFRGLRRQVEERVERIELEEIPVCAGGRTGPSVSALPEVIDSLPCAFREGRGGEFLRFRRKIPDYPVYPCAPRCIGVVHNKCEGAGIGRNSLDVERRTLSWPSQVYCAGILAFSPKAGLHILIVFSFPRTLEEKRKTTVMTDTNKAEKIRPNRRLQSLPACRPFSERGRGAPSAMAIRMPG